jgi:hypothetical protein
MKEYINKFKEIDTLSKIILISILILVLYLAYLQVNEYLKKENQNKLVEVAQNKVITFNDYFFEFYQRNRQANDRKLFLKTNEPVSQEIFDRLEFRITPKQDFSVSLKSENLIEIKFNQDSPADLKENTLIILDSGKQLFRIVYKNLNVEDSRADEIFISR